MAPSSYAEIWMTEPSLFQLPQVLSGYAAKPHAKRRERTGTPGTDEQNAENKMAEGRMESRSSNSEGLAFSRF